MRRLSLLLVGLLTGALPIPALAEQGRPMQIEDLFRFKRLTDPQLSPDGKTVAYVVTTVDLAGNRTASTIWLTSTERGTPRQLTNTTHHDRHPRWSPDGKQILFESDRSGSSQLWVIDVGGGEAHQVTALSTEAHNGIWAPDGRHVAFVSAVYPEYSDRPFNESDELNRKRKEEAEKSPVKARVFTRLFFRHWDEWVEDKRQHLFVLRVSGGYPKDVTPGDHDAYPTSDTFSEGDDFTFSPDGTHLLYTAPPERHEAWSTNYDIWRVSINGGKAEDVTKDNPAADGAPQFAPDGQRLAYRAQRRTGFEADRWELLVVACDRDGTLQGKPRSVTDKVDRSVESFTWADDGTLFFTADDEGSTALFSTELAGMSGNVSKQPVPGANSALSANSHARLLVFLNAALDHPAEVWVASPDRQNGLTTHNVSQANTALLGELDLPRPESVTVKGAGGTPMQMWILKPPGFDAKKKWPLAYLVHGGPQGAWDDGWSFRWNAEAWAAQGYVVALPNPRGSTGFGQKYVDEISGDWGGKCFEDLMAGVAYLEEQQYIDRQRMAVAGREPGAAVRAWVTACSSGEEAYSLAMLLVEESERAGKRLDVKVFATDLAERALAHARAGVYPGGIESEVSPERLARFFQKEDEQYRVRQDLRDRVVFAPQNVLQDPPFSQLDVVSCRNLLIYLEPEAQQRVLALLHFGLREGGTLVLGTSETVTGAEELFEPVDRRARIYRRVGPTRYGLIDFPPPRPIPTDGGLGFAPRAPRPPDPGRSAVAEQTRRTLLEWHTPAAVAVDRDYHVLYYHGDPRRFLQLSGEPTRNLMLLAREGVRGAVRAALQMAAARNSPATVAEGWIDLDAGRRARVAVTASPFVNPGAERDGPPAHYVVSFEQREDVLPPAPAGPDGRPETAADLTRLRSELQSTIEELQTSNEELKASHEEVVSVNEELQSANEELETSKEEMQSLNEELRTVNAQLRVKMEEHQAASSDLASLLASTDIAVLFLDTSFRIRRYTPAARDLVDLIAADVGRPLAALARKFEDPHLDDDCRAVLERLAPAEREVPGTEGRHYLRRVHPYRTTDNLIDGVVVTFVDISARRRAEEALRASEEQFRRAIEDAPIPVIMQAEDGRVLQVSRTWTDLTGYSLEDLPNANAWLTRAYGPGADAVRAHMHELFKGDRKTLDVEFVIRTRGGAERHWSFSASAPGALRDGRRFLVGMAVDVTDRRHAEAALRESEERLRQVLASATDFAIFTLDADRNVTTWSPGAAATFGYTEEELVGRSGDLLYTPEDRAAGVPVVEAVTARQDGRSVDERWHVRQDGSRFFASGVLTPLGPGGAGGFVKVLRDLTERKRLEDDLRRSRDELEERVRQRTAELERSQERALQAERLAAIGETVTALAHEGRNALQRAHACLARLAMRQEGRPEELDLTERTQAALNDLERLFDDVRAYASPVRLERQRCELAEVWRQAWAQLAERRGQRPARLEEELVAGNLACEADPFRLTQVFLNLFTNALEACPDPVVIHVSCSEADLSGRPALRLSVRDNGPGFAAEQRQHLFEPFRTTKPKGTGLGMAICRRILEAHGGTIEAGTGGPGAEVVLTLPRD